MEKAIKDAYDKMDIFQNTYEITCNKNDMVLDKDIRTWCYVNNVKQTYLLNALIQYACDKGLNLYIGTWLDNKKYIKNIRYWYGIKKGVVNS